MEVITNRNERGREGTDHTKVVATYRRELTVGTRMMEETTAFTREAT